ncbi:MAG: FMN-binding protein [Patescibacteria group bacterium]|nr:FMN-binding protein [Patescibacteria group bacterium]
MRRLIFSLSTILIFAFYVALNRQSSNAAGNKIAAALQTPTSTAITAPSDPAPSSPQSSPVQSPPPPKKSQGMYTDGTYTGSPADAYYGTVQVAAIISGGKLSNIRFMQYPSDTGHSIYVSEVALPMLKQEAIQAQSANVDIVSGATETSGAFQQSLQSALSRAKS